LKNIRATNILMPFAPDFKEPLLIHDGKMQWLFDHTGRRYLDMFGGIATVSVGHCHP
jgi:alanine-glyoxylate transaminase/(R)-3-amino-2-methylpropionate-pyruvate transaminase